MLQTSPYGQPFREIGLGCERSVASVSNVRAALHLEHQLPPSWPRLVLGGASATQSWRSKEGLPMEHSEEIQTAVHA